MNTFLFSGSEFITSTERETRISSLNDEVDFIVLTERLRINFKAKNILFKIDREGLLIHTDDCEGAMISPPGMLRVQILVY